MSDVRDRYFRRLSRKAKKSSREVAGIWVEETSLMIEEGQDKKNPEFIRELNDRVKVRLGLSSDNSHLDKFKKFLK